MENFQDRCVLIRIRFVLRGWIRIRKYQTRSATLPDTSYIFFRESREITSIAQRAQRFLNQDSQRDISTIQDLLYRPSYGQPSLGTETSYPQLSLGTVPSYRQTSMGTETSYQQLSLDTVPSYRQPSMGTVPSGQPVHVEPISHQPGIPRVQDHPPEEVLPSYAEAVSDRYN